jgi:hypothetical protein
MAYAMTSTQAANQSEETKIPQWIYWLGKKIRRPRGVLRDTPSNYKISGEKLAPTETLDILHGGPCQ